jgi:hypothetical protein
VRDALSWLVALVADEHRARFALDVVPFVDLVVKRLCLRLWPFVKADKGASIAREDQHRLWHAIAEVNAAALERVLGRQPSWCE